MHLKGQWKLLLENLRGPSKRTMKSFSRFEPFNLHIRIYNTRAKKFSRFAFFQALGVNIVLRKAALISTPIMEVNII